MKKKAVFRCQFNGNRYTVYEVVDSSRVLPMQSVSYECYKNRKQYRRGHWYTIESAIGSILFSEEIASYESFMHIWEGGKL